MLKDQEPERDARTLRSDIQALRDNGLFDVTVPVSVNGTFFAWMFQFNGEMKILEPRYVREKYAGVLEDAMDAALG